MKAKMKKGEKPPEPGEYICQKCQNRFKVNLDNLICSNCGNSQQDELVPVYMENDAEEEQMYSEQDFHGGD